MCVLYITFDIAKVYPSCLDLCQFKNDYCFEYSLHSAAFLSEQNIFHKRSSAKKVALFSTNLFACLPVDTQLSCSIFHCRLYRISFLVTPVIVEKVLNIRCYRTHFYQCIKEKLSFLKGVLYTCLHVFYLTECRFIKISNEKKCLGTAGEEQILNYQRADFELPKKNRF